MIDQEGHARLADFGLLAIVSDPGHPTTSSSYTKTGTTRWMSPELIDPGQFGLGDSRPTKESDCYAFGMVIYEVLTGQPPFAPYKDFIVTQKILKGERPGRPEGEEVVWFTDDLWEMLGLCWSPRPNNRPTIEAVLECLKLISPAWRPLPPRVYGDTDTDTDDEACSIASGSGTLPKSAPNPRLTFWSQFQGRTIPLLSTLEQASKTLQVLDPLRRTWSRINMRENSTLAFGGRTMSLLHRLLKAIHHRSTLPTRKVDLWPGWKPSKRRRRS